MPARALDLLLGFEGPEEAIRWHGQAILREGAPLGAVGLWDTPLYSGLRSVRGFGAGSFYFNGHLADQLAGILWQSRTPFLSSCATRHGISFGKWVDILHSLFLVQSWYCSWCLHSPRVVSGRFAILV